MQAIHELTVFGTLNQPDANGKPMELTCPKRVVGWSGARARVGMLRGGGVP